ncbi:MAG: 2-phospho-L-lactate transferase [Deltaproteobacteria bacterium]
MSRILLLAGGVGGARLLRGLAATVKHDQIEVIVNTADDDEFHGLHISPDVDTILYTLAGWVDRAQGWGIRGDTFRTMEALDAFGEDTWFRLGDRDLATHLFRTKELRRGRTLSQITRKQAKALGLRVHVRPMSDDRVRTIIYTPKGKLAFQEYLVRDRARSTVRRIVYDGIRKAEPAPGVLAAIERAGTIIIAPSNPFVSIGPILALRGVRTALRRANAPIVAVSPLIGGRPVKGPADRMMRGLGFRPTPTGLLSIYRGLIEGLVVDNADQRHLRAIEKTGIAARALPTLMNSKARAAAVARQALDLASELAERPKRPR